MEIKPIRTEADASREAALQEIENLFDVPPNTPAEDRLELLTILVEVYEAKHYPIPPPDPIDAILHVMDAYQLVPRDLEPYLDGLPCLRESADLYAEIYDDDAELQELTEIAISGSPE